jgi:hypothetical protein
VTWFDKLLPGLNRSALITVFLVAVIALSSYWIDTTIDDPKLAAILEELVTGVGVALGVVSNTRRPPVLPSPPPD